MMWKDLVYEYQLLIGVSKIHSLRTEANQYYIDARKGEKNLCVVNNPDDSLSKQETQ